MQEVSHTAPVYYVHDVELPNLQGAAGSCELPSAVQYDKILQNVSQNIDFTGWSSRARHQWLRWFSSMEAKTVVDGMYWITVARTFKHLADTSSFVSQLLAHVSKAHVQLYLSIPVAKRDFFFDRLSDGVAQAVLFSLFLAFPKSRTEITSDLCGRLLADVTQTLTGIRPAATSIRILHWKLNLGGGDVLRIASDPKRQQPQSVKGKLKLRFSPIIAAYLNSRHYRYFKKIKETRMADSVFPGSKFDAPSLLQDVSQTLERHAQDMQTLEATSRRQEHEAIKQLRTSRVKLETRAHQKSEYKDFANYLTSLHMLQREPHEHVSLTLLH